MLAAMVADNDITQAQADAANAEPVLATRPGLLEPRRQGAQTIGDVASKPSEVVIWIGLTGGGAGDGLAIGLGAGCPGGRPGSRSASAPGSARAACTRRSGGTTAGTGSSGTAGAR